MGPQPTALPLSYVCMDNLADYIRNNYGACARGADCYHAWDGCRRIGWHGTGCRFWQPVAAGTWAELREEMVALVGADPTQKAV